MKICMTFLAVFFFITVNAQDYVIYRGTGSVVLADGKTMEGIVEYNISLPGSVHIKVGDEKNQKFKAKEIKEFFVDSKHFLALKAKGEIGVGSDFVLAYIISPENAKFKLYKYQTQPLVTTTFNVPITTTIYVALPDQPTEVFPLSDMKFNPSKKLSKYLEDCAALSQKVANKEKDYTYGMIASDIVRQQVIEKINADYAACK